MALRTDIKKAVQKYTKLKVSSVRTRFERPITTPNKKWKVYVIAVYVKNE